MKTGLWKIVVIAALAISLAGFGSTDAYAKGKGGKTRPHYSGSKHSSDHNGHYDGGKGSSHKGGHYKNDKSNDQYGKHKD